MASSTTTVSAAAGADGAGAVVVGNAATPVSENDSAVRHRGRGGRHGGVRHSHTPEDFDKNPFINETAELKWHQIIKCIIMSPIALVRMILLFVWVLLAYLITKLATCGWRATDQQGNVLPMSACRRAMLTPVRWLLRVCLFTMGVYWIEESYPRGCNCCCNFKVDAPILVSNHCSFLDALYYSCRVLPAPVAKAAVVHYPLIGTVIKAIQPILVHRSRRARKGPGVVEQIKQRAAAAERGAGFPPVLIFPEGTTSNQHAFTMFKRGAFIPGKPVRPVVIKYPFCFHDLSWTDDISVGKIVLVALCQVYNRIQVKYLPVYHPNSEEVADAALYAKNVRAVMAKAVGVAVTEHAFEDVKLLNAVSRQYGLAFLTPQVAFADVRGGLHMTLPQVQDMMKKFRAADSNSDGELDHEEFAKAMNIDPTTPYAKKLFDHLDQDGDGRINFKEVVAGLSWTSDSIHDKDKLQLAFDVYDQDNSGTISRTEMRSVFMTAQHLSPDIANQKVEEFLADIHADPESDITFDQFCQLAAGTSPVLSLAIDVARVQAGLNTTTPPIAQASGPPIVASAEAGAGAATGDGAGAGAGAGVGGGAVGDDGGTVNAPPVPGETTALASSTADASAPSPGYGATGGHGPQ